MAVNQRQFVSRGLKDVMVVMGLHDLAPVGGRAPGERDWWPRQSGRCRATAASPMPLLPRWRHEIGKLVQELERGELDAAARSRPGHLRHGGPLAAHPRGHPAAPRPAASPAAKGSIEDALARCDGQVLVMHDLVAGRRGEPHVSGSRRDAGVAAHGRAPWGSADGRPRFSITLQEAYRGRSWEPPFRARGPRETPCREGR